MSVAVRLVNQFYKQFGEETAADLVGWLDSVEAKMQERIEALHQSSVELFRREIRVLFAEQEARFERRFAEFERRLADIQTRLAWQMLASMITMIGVIISIVGVFLRT